MSISHIETPNGQTDACVMGDMVVPGLLGQSIDREMHPESYPTKDIEPNVETVIAVKKVGGIAVLSSQS